VSILANSGDHVRPDAAFDRPLSKSTLHGYGRRFRRPIHPVFRAETVVLAISVEKNGNALIAITFVSAEHKARGYLVPHRFGSLVASRPAIGLSKSKSDSRRHAAFTRPSLRPVVLISA
jgi:hypothetical protein